MPRESTHDASTAFSALIEDYRWGHRLTPGQLAYKIGVSRQALNNWLHSGRIPSPQTLEMISQRLGIPLAELYHSAGIPVPPPAPQQYLPERQYTESELFDRMIERTVSTLRANGVTDEALLQAVVAQIRDVQYGTDRERHVAAEFAPPAPERTVPSLPTIPAHPVQQPPPAPRRTSSSSTSSSGERHERRAPRRTSGRTHSTQ